ncbi:TonB-dependent receptor [Sphingomonas sp. MAH-20]|uniref:TonB-dependent receptor n=1 Tax=Sphingomonas horti TaxID=2682842 RepID=A0A6I4J1W4_9SPHN|nr:MULTISPECIES: TonB-dependent receptor [Sphingomonas]MBA2919535.1 TonB-dependent receptor [Sphingomonas sp. CGMCC 1.13658]MVO78415.1 TonB-dependent receptor [Sphingomonas horti]
MRSIVTKALLAASLSPLAMAAQPAVAQGVITAADDRASGDADATIIVTGTRRADRTVADSPVPVDVITADSLQTSGYTETNRLLNEQVPSFNFPQPSITDGTDVVRPATLRGLDPDQTLVLINGKRRHTSALLNINGSVGRGTAAVDINLIPSIAIGRVEVLRDGAAAQYGSDAIAGVINFQLRDAPEGGRITATYGEYNTNVRGIRDVTRVLTGANGAPLLNPDGTLQVERASEDRHRVDGRTLTIAGTVGLPIGDGGHLNLSAEYQGRDPTNRTGPDVRRQYSLINGALDPRELTFDRYSHRYGDAKTDDLKFFMNFGAPIADEAELYGYLTYGYRDGESAGFYRLASDARNVPAIYPDGFLPLINSDLNDFEGVLGVKGEVGGWRYDLSGSYGRNAFDFFITNTLNRSFGPASQRAFDSGGLRYTQAMGNLDVSRDLEVGFFKNLTLAGGLEYRRETFRIRPGEPASYANGPAGGAPGAQVFPGFNPIIGGQRVDQERARHNFSAYAELDADVNDRVNLQLAGRYEDYSDFGSSLNGKLAARFEVVDGLALRGAISTGFRAPSLQQQFYAAQATNNVNGVLLDTVTLPVDNPVAVALGATPLDAEKSLSYSAGIVFTAVPRLNVTIDAYQIDIDDRIVVTENLAATRDAAGNPSGADPGRSIAQILNNAGFNTVSAARFFVNGLDSRTKGIDAVATYRFDLGAWGRVSATAGFNYNKTTIRRVLAAPGPLANIPGLVLFGRQEQGRLVRGQPRTKINLGFDYDLDRFGLTFRANRYGKVEATGGEIGGTGSGVFNDNFLKAQWVADAEARFTFAERFEIAVGANNIFDSYPTPVPVGLAGVSAANGSNVFFPTTNYVAPFSNYSPNGFNGRFIYARAAVKF